jgi:hypothetical protein
VRQPSRIKIRPEFGIALLSGAVAGAVGFAAFLLIHAIWIVPIWDIAPAVLWAVLGGVTVGWAYHVHRVRLPARPVLRVAVVFACASLVLAPGLLLLPLPLSSQGGSNPSIVVLAVAGIAGLLLLATPLIAAVLGGLLGRSVRAAVATGLAALLFVSGIGHNIPVFGFGWRGVKMWTIMLTVTAISSVTLVVVETWTSTRFRPTAGSSEGATTTRATR